MIAVIRLVIAGVIIYGLACVGLYIFQRSLIYFPQSRIILKSEINLKLPTAAGNVLVTTRSQSGRNALIYFGGNAEDVSLNLTDFSSAFPDYALYLLHYRGFGGSAGTPTEAALIADALALFDKVSAEHQQVVIVGRSLGSGIAVQVASLRPAAKLVLVTPYNSLLELASSRFPYVPVGWLLKDKYESWRYAATINIPVLVLAAENDLVIPREQTLLLKSHFKPNIVSFKTLPNTSHNTVSESSLYLPSIQEFCK
ncbi:MAG: alpha/beta hydrolase [Pseudomonadota bacterium]